MTMTVILGILWLLGVALIIWRPLARATGLSIYWEIGTGALTAIIFAIHLSTTYVQPAMMEDEIQKRPCGPGSPQGQCYSLQPSMCETAWQSAETQCKAEVQAMLKDRPSALIGPALNRCRAKRMDHALRYNRANTESEYCRAYFEFIEGR